LEVLAHASLSRLSNAKRCYESKIGQPSRRGDNVDHRFGALPQAVIIGLNVYRRLLEFSKELKRNRATGAAQLQKP
jgi:hypothetical protein